MKKYWGGIGIVFAMLLLCFTDVKAKRIEENGFAYSDEGKTIVYELPNTEKVVIPEGVEELDGFFYRIWKAYNKEKYVFDEVKELYFPSTLHTCSEIYFDGVRFLNLEVIHIAEGNKNFRFANGVLYGKSKDGADYLLWAVPSIVEEDFVMPDTVRVVRPYAFKGCTNIKSLTLSKNFDAVYKKNGDDEEYYAPTNYFLGTGTGLKAYYVSEENPKFKAVDGCLYSKEGEELYAVPKGYEGRLEIPKGTMRLREIKNCVNLTSIKIPYGVTDMTVIVDCDRLNKVVIPASVETGVSIRDCDNLETVKFKWGKLPDEIGCIIMNKCPKLHTVYVAKGTKKIYKKNIKADTFQLLEEGKYKPQVKKIKKIDASKLRVKESEGDPETFCIEWTQVLYATRYKVQINDDGKWRTVKEVKRANPIERYSWPLRLNKNHLKIKTDKIYKVRVVAYRDSIKSISNTHPLCLLEQPEILSVKKLEDGSIMLKWKKQNVSGYRICVSGSDGTEREIVVKKGTTTKKKITGLNEDVKMYSFRITAYKQSGEYEWHSKESIGKAVQYKQ